MNWGIAVFTFNDAECFALRKWEIVHGGKYDDFGDDNEECDEKKI